MLEPAAAAADEDVRVVRVGRRAEDADRRRGNTPQHVHEHSRRLGAPAAEIHDGAMGGAGRAERIGQEFAEQDRRIDEHVVVGRCKRRAVARGRRESGGNAPARGHLEGDPGRCLLPAVEIHERARTIHDPGRRPQEPAVVGSPPLLGVAQPCGVADRDSGGALRIDDPGDRGVLAKRQGIAGWAHGDDIADVLPGIHEPVGTRCPVGDHEAAATWRIRDLQLDDIRRPVLRDGHAIEELWS